jgi:hypothetical protein
MFTCLFFLSIYAPLKLRPRPRPELCDADGSPIHTWPRVWSDSCCQTMTIFDAENHVVTNLVQQILIEIREVI